MTRLRAPPEIGQGEVQMGRFARYRQEKRGAGDQDMIELQAFQKQGRGNVLAISVRPEMHQTVPYRL